MFLLTHPSAGLNAAKLIGIFVGLATVYFASVHDNREYIDLKTELLSTKSQLAQTAEHKRNLTTIVDKMLGFQPSSHSSQLPFPVRLRICQSQILLPMQVFFFLLMVVTYCAEHCAASHRLLFSCSMCGTYAEDRKRTWLEQFSTNLAPPPGPGPS
jgi:hypothetical protein